LPGLKPFFLRTLVGPAEEAAEKVFLRLISDRIGLQVLESSFAEMIEITKLVHFSAASEVGP